MTLSKTKKSPVTRIGPEYILTWESRENIFNALAERLQRPAQHFSDHYLRRGKQK